MKKLLRILGYIAILTVVSCGGSSDNPPSQENEQENSFSNWDTMHWDNDNWG